MSLLQSSHLSDHSPWIAAGRKRFILLNLLQQLYYLSRKNKTLHLIPLSPLLNMLTESLPFMLLG